METTTSQNIKKYTKDKMENCKKEQNDFILPFSRPASAWVTGSAVFLCPDGKLVEYSPEKISNVC